MFDFLIPKSKVQSYRIREIPIENFEMLGVGQINPYCKEEFDQEIYITVVVFANEDKDFDEKEGLILTEYFSFRTCPKCKKKELIPMKIYSNLDLNYLKNEEEIAFDAYEEHPSFRHQPTNVQAYCNVCQSCFEMRVKNKDLWIKEAKKIKEKQLITSKWQEYRVN